MMVVIKQAEKNIVLLHQAKGFSLVEVMAALFVLIVGVLTTITLTVNSIKQTGDSRDSLVAAMLVQEGTELVRSVRDENATRRYYDDRIPLFSDFIVNRHCALDQKSVHKMRASGNPFSCGGSANLTLALDGNNLYNHGGSSQFKRSVYFENLVTDTSIDVIVTVTWNGEPIPNPSSGCSLANSCVRNTSKLTAWLLH